MGIGNLQNAYDNQQAARKTVEDPVLNGYIFKMDAIDDRYSMVNPMSWEAFSLHIKTVGSTTAMLMALAGKGLQLGGNLLEAMSLSMPVAELFAKNLADRVGIRAPQVLVSDSEPDSTQGFVKQRAGV